MSWFDTVADDEQQSVDELQRQGITGKPTESKKNVGLFDGAVSSPIRGAGVGFIKAADTLAKPLDYAVDVGSYGFDYVKSGGDIAPFSDYRQNSIKARDDLVYGAIEQLEDKENTGMIGNIGVALGDYIWRGAVGGIAGGIGGAAALTGGTTGHFQYNDLTRKGVDSYTALQVAGVNAAGDAVATALPLSYGFKGTGGIIKDGLFSIGGATALTTGMQFTSSEVLKDAGYQKEAKQFEVTGESFATDVILNTLMFGAARGVAHHRDKLEKEVEEELQRIANDPDARSDVINEALVINQMEFDQTTSSVHPENVIQKNNHLINLNLATEQLRSGQPVQVPNDVKGETKTRSFNIEASALPTNAKTIFRRAKQEGVDPTVALTIAHLESNFDHTAKPPIGKDGKRLSSAHGLYQVIDKTWKGQGGGDRTSIDEQIRMGFKHIKQANNHMRKSIGRDPVAHEQYLGHLLGPEGASRVLSADPNAKLIDIVKTYDAKNADAIVKNNGMTGMTVEQAIGKWRGKWNTVSARYRGDNTTTAIGADGSSYDFAFEVKDFADLITSNDALYGVNPHYPSELQPRDRTREASRQQIERMASELNPELLADSIKISDGAPILGLDNVVESGNGRTLAIGKAYESGRADAYRDFVQNWASQRGMDITGLNQPVLVRTRLSDVDRVGFTRLANESDMAQFSATERAITDADRLPDGSLLKINNDGSLNLDGSMDFVRGFVDQVPQSERATILTGDGRLTQDGKRRMETALAQRAYNDSSLVTRLAENLDDDSKTVLNAMLRVAPQLTQLGDLVRQGGRHQNTIAQDLAQAAQKLSDLKANGLRVDDYLNQGQLIDDGLSAGARDFLNVFSENSRSAKAISDNIQSKINEVEAMGDPRQGSLFGDGPEESAALNVIMSNPDQDISVSRVRPDGEMEEITMTLREYHAELEAEARQAQEDTLAAQTAISCALQFGV